MQNTTITKAQIQRRVDGAQGKIPCDLIIANTRYLDVFTCKWREGDVAILDGTIVGVDSGLKANRTLEGKGKAVVPGFIDAHVHLESSLLLPKNFEAAVLPRGTTSAVCDPHELANVQGVSGVEFFLKSAQSLNMNLQVMLSSCVPATHLETNGGGTIEAKDLLPLLKSPKALGLAEMMNVPGVLGGDPNVLEKLEAFSQVRIDGHCPLLRGNALSAYAAAGISSCHESTEFEEAREKLTKGIAIWIREGSVAKDLRALAPLLNMASSTSLGFCTDDRNPRDIATEGHIDYLVRTAIGMGVQIEVAYRAASWSVARHYGMDRLGAVAPGYEADLLLLEDMADCRVAEVIKSGRIVSEMDLGGAAKESYKNSIRASVPEARDLLGPEGRVHVIVVEKGKIITGRTVAGHGDPGVARLTVLERYGRGTAPANAYVQGFGTQFTGAIASSVGHDSHNLIVVGKETEDMKVALDALIRVGGGFCVVKNGRVLAELPLPFGGLMTDWEDRKIVSALEGLHQASKEVGCELPEPFLQLAFLSLPVIPTLKLTDKGLVDVEKFNFIDVRAA